MKVYDIAFRGCGGVHAVDHSADFEWLHLTGVDWSPAPSVTIEFKSCPVYSPTVANRIEEDRLQKREDVLEYERQRMRDLW